ncbi:MAG: hypothetical protein IKH19_02535 [Muribaculaceae bacterium]|nr:hypothetical protein [Muribaculaceae bacterium]
MKKIIYFLLFLAMASCGNKQEEHHCAEQEEFHCAEPITSITIQPYEDVSRNMVSAMAEKLKQEIESQTEVIIVDIEILPNKELSKSLLNKTKTRYRAERILDKQLSQLKHNSENVIIGVTNQDISTTLRGKEDWGIQGLAYMGKDVCVISTYRLKNKKDLWKVAFHEFFHAAFNYPHCPFDNPTCIMQDCHGVGNWRNKNSVCKQCYISKKH